MTVKNVPVLSLCDFLELYIVAYLVNLLSQKARCGGGKSPAIGSPPLLTARETSQKMNIEVGLEIRLNISVSR